MAKRKKNTGKTSKKKSIKKKPAENSTKEIIKPDFTSTTEIPILTRRAPLQKQISESSNLQMIDQEKLSHEIRQLVTEAVNESKDQIIENIMARLMPQIEQQK